MTLEAAIEKSSRGMAQREGYSRGLTTIIYAMRIRGEFRRIVHPGHPSASGALSPSDFSRRDWRPVSSEAGVE